MALPFITGHRYRNQRGGYLVLAIDGDQMTIEYDDGSRQTVSIAIQQRIWERIQDEEAPLPTAHRTARRKTGGDSQSTAPIRDLVAEVLAARFAAPFPPDITDQLCAAIEHDAAWRERYDALVEHFSSKGKDGRAIVNNSLGWYTKELTGLATLERGVRASQSTLISSYSRLGPPELVPRKDVADRPLLSLLAPLSGHTLHTLGQDKPFDVIQVASDGVTIFIHETAKERLVPMTEIEPAWQHLLQAGLMTLSEIRERGFSEMSPVYVAALLAELPGVTHGPEPLGADGRDVVTLQLRD